MLKIKRRFDIQQKILIHNLMWTTGKVNIKRKDILYGKGKIGYGKVIILIA